MHARFAISLILALTTLSASPVSAKPVKCDPGRFVPRATLIVGSVAGVSTGEAIVVTAAPGARISISPACDPTRVRLKATKKGTKVVATWKKGACRDVTGKVKLKGRIVENCAVLRGSIKKPKVKKATFTADRGAGCGDGLLDRDGGEECENTGQCGAGLECRDCSCLPPRAGEVTTTSTSTTTTTGIESTTTTATIPPPLGVLRLDAPSALEFGAVAVGGSASSTFVVRNVGTASVPLQIGTGSASFIASPGEVDLGGGEQVEVTVEFRPQSEGHQSGAIVIAPALDRLGVLLHGFGGSAAGTGPTTASQPLFFRSTSVINGTLPLIGIKPDGTRFVVDSGVRRCLLPDDEVIGDACTEDADCSGGRVCVTFSYCEGGENAGSNCTHNVECPGGFCPADLPLDPIDMCSDGTGALYLLTEEGATDPTTQEPRGIVARLDLDPATGNRTAAKILYRPESGTTQIACDGRSDASGLVYVPEHHEVENPPAESARDEIESLVAISKVTGAAQVVSGFEDVATAAGLPESEDFEPVEDLHVNRDGTSLFVTIDPLGLTRIMPQPPIHNVVDYFDQFVVHPDGSLVFVLATDLGRSGLLDVFRISPADGPLAISALTPCATFEFPNSGGRTVVGRFAVGRAQAAANDGTILVTFTTGFTGTPPVSTSLIPRGTVAIDAPAGTTGCSVRGLINLELLSNDLMTF